LYFLFLFIHQFENIIARPHIASLVDLAFLRATIMETAMNGSRNGGLWSVDRGVFTDDDFAPSMVADRTETIQLKRPTAEGIENFGLSSAHAAEPATPKQTTLYNG
jgi:hypothetical protein